MAVDPVPENFRRTEGPTPNGGAYAIGYFFDRHWKSCPESEAYHIEIHEFDGSDNIIFRTSMSPPPEPEADPDPI